MRKLTTENKPHGDTCHDINICFEACQKCSGVNCCGNISKDGIVGQPYLSNYDINQISEYTGLEKSFYSESRLNSNNGNTVFFIKIKNNNECYFFDSLTGKCVIYDIRPIDCRLFPFDIEKYGDEYYWILYKHRYCKLTDADMGHFTELKKNVISLLGKEIFDYATIRVPGMDEIGYVDIDEDGFTQAEIS